MSTGKSRQRIFACWWPLAASWLLIGLEMPIIIVVLGRMPDAELHMAALGGIALPLAWIIEAPIIMLLSASTALSRDRASYQKLRDWTHGLGFSLTILHILMTFTPLYYVIAQSVLALPPMLVEPTRHSLMWLTPWTWSIASRRFQQGVLIRFGQSKTVGKGTIIRLLSLSTVLLLGFLTTDFPGSTLGAMALSSAVFAEAVFIAVGVLPIIIGPLAAAPPAEPALTTRSFLRFYIPLALTALLGMLTQPMGSVSLSRMADASASLAVWPVLATLVFVFRSSCLAITEVSVAKLEHPEDRRALFPFCVILMGVTTGLLLLVAVTRLSTLWFRLVAAFPEGLTRYGTLALYLAIPLPALTVLQSWYQGNLLFTRNTRPITEAIAIFLLISAILLIAGIAYTSMPGLYYFNAVLLAGAICQTAWLWRAKNATPTRTPPAHGKPALDPKAAAVAEVPLV